MEFGASVEHGTLAVDDQQRWASLLKRLDGQRVLVSVERLRPRRSLAQNRLLWKSYQKALGQFAELTGFTKDELHDAMKRRFLDPEILYTPSGMEIGRSYSTKKLSVPQFSEYLERVHALFAGFGVDLMEEP